MGKDIYGNYNFQGDAYISGVNNVFIGLDATGATEAVRFGQLTKEIFICEFTTNEKVVNRLGQIFYRVPSSMNSDIVTGFIVGVATTGATFDTTVNIGAYSKLKKYPSSTEFIEVVHSVTLSTGDKISIDVANAPIVDEPKGLTVTIMIKKVI